MSKKRERYNYLVEKREWLKSRGMKLRAKASQELIELMDELGEFPANTKIESDETDETISR